MASSRKPSRRRLWLLGVLLMAAGMAGFGLLSAGETPQSYSRSMEALAAPSIPETDPLLYLPLVFKDFSNVIGPGAEYVLLGWNDLGMHCYNRDFQDLAVLPPYNTLWAQVIQRGDPPQIVTQGISVVYSFPENTYSVAPKSNFWEYAEHLFGLSQPLPPNTGLTGIGLSGQMEASDDHFQATGIPLTEFNDNALYAPYPYQKALLVARSASNGAQLASLTVVAPVSTEMHCEYCHSDGQVEGIATGRVGTNILTFHDQEELTNYPSALSGPLMNRRPVLCAWCHASNALGLAGQPGIPNLSNAMHGKHAEEANIPAGTTGCYYCHPGPSTKCLRDVMSSQFGLNCTSCHGTLSQVAANPNPWLNEPRCDICHTPTSAQQFQQDNPLYRMSTGHGGVRCEGCHDSTHAIAPSSQYNDGIKFGQLQGQTGTLAQCTTCHLTQPDAPGPHVK